MLTREFIIAAAKQAGVTIHRPDDLFIDEPGTITRDYRNFVEGLEGKSGRFRSIDSIDEYDVLELVGVPADDPDLDTMADSLDPEGHCVFEAPAGYKGDTSQTLLVFFD